MFGSYVLFLCCMKYRTPLFLLLLVLACNQQNEKVVTTGKAEPQTEPVVSTPDIPAYNLKLNKNIWRATDDYKKIKNPLATGNWLHADTLIAGLNEYYENIFLEKIKISGDTIYTVIKNSKYLSEQMGSTGAEIYVADVVLNLTAVPGIKYVTINMQEGSHAQPGTWRMDDFKKYSEAK